eukprot:21084-Heterococcus_DN1.PRE.5
MLPTTTQVIANAFQVHCPPGIVLCVSACSVAIAVLSRPSATDHYTERCWLHHVMRRAQHSAHSSRRYHDEIKQHERMQWYQSVSGYVVCHALFHATLSEAVTEACTAVTATLL